jgi:hypothetical protein
LVNNKLEKQIYLQINKIHLDMIKLYLCHQNYLIIAIIIYTNHLNFLILSILLTNLNSGFLVNNNPNRKNFASKIIPNAIPKIVVRL